MSTPSSSAVVLGASMSGLLAARVLSDHVGRVTIVERDTLPDAAEPRRGVPQAAHAHGLLASGYRLLDGFFPGMMDELEGLGAPRGDVVGDFLWFLFGRWKCRHDTGIRGMTVSRPCLEAAVRRRVKALPSVTFLERTDGLSPRYDARARRVVGLDVRSRDDDARDTVEADVVVDASGRGSRAPKWLAEWGYGPPEESLVKVDVGYATRTFERRPGDFFDTLGGVISGTPPTGTRLAAVLAAEGNRWVVTLAGVLGDHPPTAEPEWLAFAASLPVPAVRDLVTSTRPLTDTATYRFPANQRRRYERMHPFPDGFLVLGDAACSFNPIYGQGMSVAAQEARALDHALAGGLEGLTRRFYDLAGPLIDVPWLIATGEDLRFPAVEGHRSPASRVMNRYFERVHAVASADRVVCRRFFEVLSLLEPPSVMMSPGILRRVLVRRPPDGQGSPWPLEP